MVNAEQFNQGFKLYEQDKKIERELLQKNEGEKREMEEGVRGTPSVGKARHAFDQSTEAISLFAYLDVRQRMTSCDTRDIMEASLRRYRAHVRI